jgi:hypothetical protein
MLFAMAAVLAIAPDGGRAGGRTGLVAATTLPGGARIESMAVDGDTAYVGLTEDGRREFAAFDLGRRPKPRHLWSLELGTAVHDVAVAGGIAYLATASDVAELMIVDLAVRAVVGTLDVPGPEDGVLVQVGPDGLWLGTAAKTGADEAFAVDVTDPTRPVVASSRAAVADLRAPLPPAPRGYAAGGTVVARGRGRTHARLTVLATDRRSRELQVVAGLDDDVTVPDLNGDGVRHLACLGDSNTLALMDKNPGSWCHHLEQAVWHHELRITNLGEIGAAMTPPFVSEAFAQLALAVALDVDVVIASFGGNDVFSHEPYEIAAAAAVLLEEAAVAGIVAFFLTPAPRYDFPGLDAKIEDTVDLLRTVLPPGQLIDVSGLLGTPEIQPDLVHLNLEGTLKVGRVVEALIVVPAPSPAPAQLERDSVERVGGDEPDERALVGACR